MVRGPDLHSGREVEDNTIVVGRPRSPPSNFHGLTDLNSVVRFRLRESLRTVLVSKLCPKFSGALIRQPPNEFSMLGSQFDRLLLRVLEYNLAERWTGGIVHV